MTIAISPQIARADVKSDVIVSFSHGLQSTPALVASVEAGERPACLVPLLATDWTIDVNPANGHRSVRVPTFAYSGSYVLTSTQFGEVAAWLDRVAPGWGAAKDAYGNPAVGVRDAAPQRKLDAADRVLAAAWKRGPGTDAA